MKQTKEKFTPGPWKATETININWGTETALACPIEAGDSIVALNIITGPFVDDVTEAEGEANAALISAAPDLYAALEALLKAVDSGIESDPELWRRGVSLANKALAKARGES